MRDQIKLCLLNIFLLALICAALTHVCVAHEATLRMEQIVQSYVDSKKFMGAVLVAQD